jgi:hypothetical protein
VWGAEDEGRDEPAIGATPKHGALAARLREAVAIGAVTDLHSIANELASGDESDAAIGRRLARLASDFDFAGVSELANALDANQVRSHVD